MSNNGIWPVTGVRTEARHLANLAAYRANMETGAWIARAIRQTLGLPEPVATAEDDRNNGPQPDAAEPTVVAAFQAMGDRLDQPRARASNIEKQSIATLGAETAAAAAPATEAEPDAVTPPETGAADPLPTVLRMADPPAQSANKARFRPWLTALAATVLIISASLVYVATSDLGDLPVRAQTSAAEIIQNLRAIAWTKQQELEIRSPTKINASITDPRARARAADPVASLRLAAASGDRRSQLALGMRYATGQGLKLNTRRAALWLHRAAAQGSADAQFNLAVIYSSTDGSLKELKKAFILYKRAAERAHPRALHNLGLAHAIGHGTAVDLTEAARLLEVAAEKGVPMASFNLGIFNEFGLATIPNPVIAMQRYRYAAENGDPRATVRLRRLRSIVGSGDTVPSKQRIAAGQALLRPLPLDPGPGAPSVANDRQSSLLDASTGPTSRGAGQQSLQPPDRR